ncbi:hypothetical protein R1sor_006053 [Riccia sorocarpa]|uniref:Uncharacterized protein n=1 Tax=Riccia sorocarpa TaxID=122646 RepID=A0ABD3HLJ3_9MARC
MKKTWRRIAWIRDASLGDASLGYIRDASLGDTWGRIAYHRLRHQPTWGRISELSSGDLACAISPPGDASPSWLLEISPAPSAHLGTHLRACFWRSRLRHQPTWGRISELASGDLACAISPPGDASPSWLLETRLRHQPTWGCISELASGDLACAISPPGDASPSLLLEISPAPSAHLGTHL